MALGYGLVALGEESKQSVQSVAKIIIRGEKKHHFNEEAQSIDGEVDMWSSIQ